ncbi:hypothetical protein [Chitinophaga tropicalis]|uniref:Uncharacterized protein n=1 Tax=Chitinophaga tropicalis TaxID=2683588 RepID=A0A7K1U8I7_9BACT|nr:hypothetical protein [Chitinophaga tropicalis]MVT10697.1 hypothetical protein [Chitinophaga tropicalis]
MIVDLGTDLRTEIAGTKAELKSDIAKLDAKVGKLETRFDKLETRFDKLDTRFDKLDTRVGSIETKVERLETKVDDLQSGFNVMNGSIENLKATTTMLQLTSFRMGDQLNRIELKLGALTEEIKRLHSEQDIMKSEVGKITKIVPLNPEML